MDKAEILKALTFIKVAYPNAYSKYNNEDLQALSSLWFMHFKDYDYTLTMNAINVFISKDLTGYAPTIAQIKDIVRRFTQPQEKTEGEIWAPVHKAICNSAYHSMEEWEKLPQDLKECVTPSQLRNWAMSTDEQMAWAKKEVVAEYRQRQQRQKEIDLLPTEIKNQILLENKDEEKKGKN